MRIDLTADPVLEPDEYVIQGAIARSALPIPPLWRAVLFAEGKLYRTNHRLVFMRSWLNLPWGPRSFDIPLQQVLSCRTGGFGFGVVTDRGEFWFRVMNSLWPPHYWFHARDAAEWVEDITRAIRPEPT